MGHFSEDLMDHVRETVDDEVLVGEFERRVDAAKNFEAAEVVERAVSIPNRAENLDGTFSRRGLALFDRDSGAEFPLHVADMARGDEQIAGTNTQIEIAWGDFLELHSEAFGDLLRRHANSSDSIVVALNGVIDHDSAQDVRVPRNNQASP